MARMVSLGVIFVLQPLISARRRCQSLLTLYIYGIAICDATHNRHVDAIIFRSRLGANQPSLTSFRASISDQPLWYNHKGIYALSNRTGRKRKVGKRESNGRIERQPRVSSEQDTMRTAIEYRQSVFGLSEQDSKDQKAATLLGRLCLQGAVSEAQWQAGEDWLRLVNARYAATNAPRGFKSAGSSALAIDEEAEAARYWSLKARFDKANAAVEDHAPVLDRVARFEALSAIVVREVDAPHMHGALRTALNGLVKFFKTEARAA